MESDATRTTSFCLFSALAASFNHCLDEGRYTKEVTKDMAAGQKAGIRGTPSFILGKTTEDGEIKGRLIRGALPYQVFKTAIEELLEQVEGTVSGADWDCANLETSSEAGSPSALQERSRKELDLSN